MPMTISKISAIGTRGQAKGKLFIASPDSSGRFVLNRKQPASAANPTNRAVNKVYAETLDQAAALLATDEFLINLVSENGKRALREYGKVLISK